MPLANTERGVALVAKYFRDGGCVVADVAELTGEAGTEVRHRAHPNGVLRPAGQERGTGRRAERGDVEVGELGATRSERIDVRRVDIGAVTTKLRKASVVEQNNHNIWGILTRVRRFVEPRFGVRERLADRAFET